MKKANKITKIISMQLIEQGYSKEELSVLLGISLSTFYNRLKKPAEFKINEIRILSKTLKISEERLLEAV